MPKPHCAELRDGTDDEHFGHRRHSRRQARKFLGCPSMKRGLLLFRALAVALAASSYNVEWTSPTVEPGQTQDGRETYQGGMPVGNGKLTALAWPNTTAGGVGVYVGHQDAMSSWTELFKLGMVQVQLSPNPFDGGPYFNQTLDLATASVHVYAGGSSLQDYAALISIWVDANSDAMFIDVSAGPGVRNEFLLKAFVYSVRPRGVWTYTPPFSTCSPISSQPDVLVDPLPPAVVLSEAPPVEDRFRHSTGDRRPLRQLFRSGKLSASHGPRIGEFQAGSVIIYHRNSASDGLTINSTLTQQGLAGLIPTTPDYWVDNQFGFVMDAGTGPQLSRVSPWELASLSPQPSYQLRIIALAVQTASATDWLADLAALVAIAEPTPWPAHAAYWQQFWARSFIHVNATQASAGWERQEAAIRERYSRAAEASPDLPVPGASLWLRASSLSGAANGSLVSAWPDDSASNTPLSQPAASLQPEYLTDGLGAGYPGVRFDGVGTFLHSSSASLPAQATLFAVFRDDGSSGGNSGYVCCSGVVYWQGSDKGLSTVPPSSSADDDDGFSPGSPVVAMLDYSGSSMQGNTDVRGRVVSATAVYAAGSANLAVDQCPQASSGAQAASGSTGVYVGTRNNEYGRFFRGVIGEVVAYPRALNGSEVAAVQAYLAAQWPLSPRKACGSAQGFQLSQMYAVTRFVQAVQSRGTLWPIKFNGMAFVAAMDKGGGEPDFRQWGASNWWQNTRLPYGAMLMAGDFEEFRVILDYYANMEVFLSQRTRAYWGHDGMWTTETQHLSGAYDQTDYGCTRPAGYPYQLMTSGYLHLDHGGDSGTGEYGLMALDYLCWTNDTDTFVSDYMKVPVQAANYFMYHFQNTSAGRTVVWPAQVLETYWCDWQEGTGYTNCCTDDSPTISGMMTLFEKLMELPTSITTPAQRTAWGSFLSSKMPLLPTSSGSGGLIIAPAASVSSGTHNDEGPGLYAAHPHRVFTKGRAVATGLDISLGLRTLAAEPFAQENQGWNYGLNAAALLGVTSQAAEQVLERAATRPAPGYRFLGFAPHFQDFDPSADHFANMNRCLQEMLLQSGEDGLADTTVVLFPAWPCGWDVSFRLWAPLNTTVDVEYAGGALVSFLVTPPSRASAVKWANCVTG